ncbi:putative AB hydrolase-1 domain-containing protein [Seiridium cardinale]
MSCPLPDHQSFVTTRGYRYSYIRTPGQSHNQTLLLIHGWPSHIDDWFYQIRYFAAKGYGLIVPDMLGYGGSSNPGDVFAYRLRPITQDLAELLDHTHSEKVVGVGHDWGATILSRFAMYYPERVTALAFLGIGAPKPGTPFNLDIAREMAKKASGSEILGHIAYITRDSSSRRMMEQNPESVMDVMFASDPASWDRYFHPLNGFKTFVERGCRQPVGTWFTKDLRDRHLETFGRTDGYLGASRYYMMLDQNLSVPDEKGYEDFTIKQPVLLIVPNEPASASQMQAQMLSVWASRILVVQVDSGHWVHMERSDEANQAIEELMSNVLYR